MKLYCDNTHGPTSTAVILQWVLSSVLLPTPPPYFCAISEQISDSIVFNSWIHSPAYLHPSLALGQHYCEKGAPKESKEHWQALIGSKPDFKSCLPHPHAVWPQASYLTSLDLSSLIYNMGIIIPSWKSFNDGSVSRKCSGPDLEALMGRTRTCGRKFPKFNSTVSCLPTR